MAVHPDCLSDGKFLVDFYILHPDDSNFNAPNQHYWLEYHPRNLSAVISGGKKSNKRKGEYLEGDARVTNNSINSEFKIKKGESWQDVFCGDNICHRVEWSGEKNMCPRWFSRGFCFKSCRHSVIHVEDSKVQAAKRKLYKEYLTKIRG